MNLCNPNNFPESPLAPKCWRTCDVSRDMAQCLPLTSTPIPEGDGFI